MALKPTCISINASSTPGAIVDRRRQEDLGVSFRQDGESWTLVVRAPRELAKYIARKGSITVDGVSLTVNRVDAADFWINLIPHTVEVTTLKRLSPGARVNLEVDLIARYVERIMHGDEQIATHFR